MMKRFLVLTALALAVMFGQVVMAQTASTSVKLGWTAPADNLDGSVIASGVTLTFNLYQGPKAGPFVKVASGLTGGTTTVTSLAAGNCFALTAVESNGASSAESPLSNTSCILQPGAPTSVTVSLSITVQ